MPRLMKGQVRFGRPEMKTCHDIRSWRACPECGDLGHKQNMIESGYGKNATYYHGRCFVYRFGMEQLVRLPQEKVAGITMGDL